MRSKSVKTKGLIAIVVVLSVVLVSVLIFAGVFFVKYLKDTDRTDEQSAYNSRERHVSPEELCAFSINNNALIQTLEEIKSSFDSEWDYERYMYSRKFKLQANDYPDGLCIYINNTEAWHDINYREIKHYFSKEAIYLLGEFDTDPDWNYKLENGMHVRSFEFKNEIFAKMYFEDLKVGNSDLHGALNRGEASVGIQDGIDCIVWIDNEYASYQCVYREGKYVFEIYGSDEDNSNAVLDKIVSLCQYFELPIPS